MMRKRTNAVRKISHNRQKRVQGKTMKTNVRVTGVLLALFTFLGGALPGHSAVLVGTQGSSFLSLTDYGAFSTYQPLADVGVIGSSDVSIGGFGVFAAAEAAGKISWVIFQ